MFDLGVFVGFTSFPVSQFGSKGFVGNTYVVSSVTLTYVINVRFEIRPLGSGIPIGMRKTCLRAMEMYEHLLNLDSVFSANLPFGLDDMLFRIALSDEVCVWETFSLAVIRHLAPWDGCTSCFDFRSLVRFFGRHR